MSDRRGNECQTQSATEARRQGATKAQNTGRDEGAKTGCDVCVNTERDEGAKTVQFMCKLKNHNEVDGDKRRPLLTTWWQWTSTEPINT